MKKDFIVLSLYEVHLASAAIMINGEIVAATHEERYSRIKADHGFPLKAARFCLEQANVDPSEVDAVVMINESFGPNGVSNILFKRAALYGIEDWIFENENYWKPTLLKKERISSYFELMGGWDRVPEHYYDLSKLDMRASHEVISSSFNEARKNAVEKHLGISRERVVFAPHYLCHHYHAYYSGPIRGKDALIMHLEGDGGIYNSAISRLGPKGLEVIGGSNESDLGRLYQWITLLLGMKPYNHEYKLMGLAPYATEHEVEKSMKVFESLFRIDEKSLAVVYDQRPSDLYFHFRERFQGHRFDGIAGALQRFFEKWTLKWVKLALKKTGSRRICYGGGAAMNVKANMLLSQTEDLDDLFVPLSPGDESNVFGAAYWLTEQHIMRNNGNPETILPMRSPYLGPECTQKDILASLDGLDKEKFYVNESIGGMNVSELLAKGWTVAACQGRAEFGQRALGNRSILAHPSQPGIVNKINKQIKYRDFWMPFCPTILEDDQQDFLVNQKNLESNFMTQAFPVKKSRHSELQGVIHPGDGTARPQILKREKNPAYYELIKSFKSHTGIGCLLNTSFNLHGEPIINSPHDAISTFLRSELDALWMSDVLISRHSLSSH